MDDCWDCVDCAWGCVRCGDADSGACEEESIDEVRV